MRTLIHSIFLMLTIGVWCSPLPASQVSFRQPPLQGGDGLLSDPNDQRESDNFSFAAQTNVISMRWWGTYFAPTPETDQFTIRFYNHNQGTNGPESNPSSQYTSLAVSRSDSGIDDMFGDTIYQYQAKFPSLLVFNAGPTSYYLSVLNSTANGWYWQKSTASGSNWFRFGDGSENPWLSSTGGNLAFEFSPPGDYDGDFDVDVSDYNLWRQSFGNSGVLPADGNSNGRVDAVDYVTWRKNAVPHGDYDRDYDVDLNDRNLWRQTFGNSGVLPADGNSNGNVDAADYVIWRKNLGTSAGVGASLAVPEPKTVITTLLSIMLVFQQRWRTVRAAAAMVTRTAPQIT